MESLRAIASLIGDIFPTFSSNDNDIMSSETRKILSNDIDRESYIHAVRELRRNPDKPVTITLSNKEEITLSR